MINVEYRRRTWGLAARLAASLLMAAALFKTYEAVTRPVDSPWLSAAVVAFEWGLGVWLISGWWWGRRFRGFRRFRGAVVRVVAIVTFLVFAVLSLRQALLGAASCGCFGRFEVDPRLTAIVDIMIAGLLMYALPPKRSDADEAQPSAPPRRAGTVVGLWLPGVPGVVLAGAVLVGPIGSQVMRGDGRLDPAVKLVLLEPERWIGQRFALLDHLEGDASPLETGRWTVVLVRPDCGACDAAVARLDELERGEGTSRSPRRALIVIGADKGNPEFAHSATPEKLTVFRLRPDRDWFAQTPQFIELNDGVVVQTGLTSIAMSESAIAADPVVHPPAQGQVPQNELDSQALTIPMSTEPATDLPEQLTANLGYITPGSVHRVQLVVRNDAAEPMRFERMTVECSCTIIESHPTSIAPGSCGVFDITFEAPHTVSQYTKRIHLKTASLNRPAIVLTVSAAIGLPLEVSPGTLAVDKDRLSAKAPTITVTNHGKTPVRLTYSSADHGCCIALVPREPVAGGASVEIPLRIRSDTAPPEAIATVTIHTDHEAQKSIKVNVELAQVR